jgi:Flp pilus assembly protein TadG
MRILKLGKIFGLGTSGAALVEFAIIAPLVIVLGLGVADYGLLMNNTTVLEAGVRSGAEIVKSNPDITTTQMSPLFPSTATIQPLTFVCKCIDGAVKTPCPPTPNTSPCAGKINPNTTLVDSRVLQYATVSATDPFSPFVMYHTFGFPTSLTATAVARIQ